MYRLRSNTLMNMKNKSVPGVMSYQERDLEYQALVALDNRNDAGLEKDWLEIRSTEKAKFFFCNVFARILPIGYKPGIPGLLFPKKSIIPCAP